MKTPIRILLGAAVAVCHVASAAPEKLEAELILRDVNIVAIDEGTILPRQTVVIRGHRIIGVSESLPARRHLRRMLWS